MSCNHNYTIEYRDGKKEGLQCDKCGDVKEGKIEESNYEDDSDDKQIIDKPIKNSGFVFEEIQEVDHIFGAYSPQVGSYLVIMPNGHGWLDIQRVEERQFNRFFDTYSCVTFAILKALSYYFKAVYNIDINISEMFTSRMSGTIPGRGNSVRTVLECVRLKGYLLEIEYPFTPDTTEGQFFAPISIKLQSTAKGRLKQWKINWEAVSTSNDVSHEQIKEALKYTPVIVTGYAWAQYLGEGVYHDYNNMANHCFLVVDHNDNTKEDWDLLADDSYPQDTGDGIDQPQEFLKRLAKDFRIWSAHKITVERIVEPINNANFYTKIKNMALKLVKDIHMGYHLVKDNKIQKITSWWGLLVLMAEFFNPTLLTDDEIAKFTNVAGTKDHFFPENN